MYRAARAFTLIELLIVIAIIGILSATVLVSLNTARGKARTTAVVSQVIEFRKLMELNYSQYGSYTQLNKGWVGTGTTNPTCENRGYQGIYAAQAVAICKSLAANAPGEYKLQTGVSTNAGYNANAHFSIMVRLPNNTLFCLGSSGRSTTGAASTYVDPGCWANP